MEVQMGFHVLGSWFLTLSLSLPDFSHGFNGIQAPLGPSQVKFFSDALSECSEQCEGYMRGSQAALSELQPWRVRSILSLPWHLSMWEGRSRGGAVIGYG